MSSDIHALSGAYAVDALDDLERDRFEAHLAECSACRDEVASLTEAAGLLGEAVATTPPAGLRDRVLADISKVRPLPPLPAQVPPADAPEPPAEQAPVPTTVQATDELSARREVARRRRLPKLVAAAAAVFALGAGVTVWHPWVGNESSQGPVLADQVLEAPDATRQVRKIDGAEATLVRSASVGRAVLVTKDMPAPPDGKVYELWFQTAEGEVLPAGLMSEAGDQSFLLKGDAASAVWAGITVEPAGGSDVPSLPTIAAFDFKDTA